MIIQMVFAYLNRIWIGKICKPELNTENKYNILIVGYREDENLFRQCLISHKRHLFNPVVNRIIVVIDGDENDDLYMADIFKEVFSFNGTVYTDQHPYSFISPAICILQKHKGKRHVLFTGLNISITESVEGVICSDSDTEMDKNCVEYLIKTLESSDDIGAVTGMMTISNRVSFISYMSYIRYWFACNLERAYQSYNGVVICVSGPIGIYRINVVRTFLIGFISQTFMGKECTYGDDRHLTNNILAEGYKVKYNHLATCKTDTPENLFRFFNQQTRWCKSSYRELLWTVKYIHKHSFWLTIDILYQTAYSLIVLSSLIYILYIGNLDVMVSYFVIIAVMNIIKGFYAAIIEYDPVYILYSLYGYIYIYFIIPSKIYAGLTLSDTSWGTSSRKFIFDSINYGHVFMITWIVALSSIILYNLSTRDVDTVNIVCISCVSGYILISVLFIKLNTLT